MNLIKKKALFWKIVFLIGINMKNQKSRGFTLLEMIIAVGVFTVFVTIAMSGLLNLSDANKNSTNFSNLSDNIRFALEMMAKEIRTGTDYDLSGDILTFQNARGDTIAYELDSFQIKRSLNGGAFSSLTSGDIKVEELKFVVSGALARDGLQPKILIRIKASVLFKNKKTEINLQTLVSSRNLDS